MADEVTRETTVNAPPEEVWRSLTEPGPLAEWLGSVTELELRPGGELSLILPGGERRHGFVEASEPPRLLAFWWRADGDDAELTHVQFELDDAGEGATLLRVTESRPMAMLDARAHALALGGGAGAGPQLSAGVPALA